MNFKANPPFNEMRQSFATFKKEIRMAPIFSRTFWDVTKNVYKMTYGDKNATFELMNGYNNKEFYVILSILL